METNAIYSLNGVYAIKFDGDGSIYVGATSRTFGDRTYQHLNSLRKGTHTNKALQSLFNTLGEPALKVFVLETGLLDKKSLVRAEKKWCHGLKKKYPLLNTVIGGRISFRKKPCIYKGLTPLPIVFANYPPVRENLAPNPS